MAVRWRAEARFIRRAEARFIISGAVAADSVRIAGVIDRPDGVNRVQAARALRTAVQPTMRRLATPPRPAPLTFRRPRGESRP
jgi:hypothetical protein